jgi:2'-5' RNA ligase
MTERFRGFIATPLPEEALQALIDVQQRLRAVATRKRDDLRWCRPELLHVTLKFLGYLPRAQIPELVHCVTRRAAQVETIDATLSTLGVFGSPRRARVLHVAVTDPSNALTRLADGFDEDAEAFGVARETRAYTPHITLARWKQPGNATAFLTLGGFEPIAVQFNVLRLYESQPGRGGSRYTILSESALCASG